MRNFSVFFVFFFFKFGPVVKDMSFKDILIFSSGGHFVAEPFVQFGRGHYEYISVKLFRI